MAKGEIARFEQFLLWSQCFQRLSTADASKCIYRWEEVNPGCVILNHRSTNIFFRLLINSNVTSIIFLPPMGGQGSLCGKAASCLEKAEFWKTNLNVYITSIKKDLFVQPCYLIHMYIIYQTLLECFAYLLGNSADSGQTVQSCTVLMIYTGCNTLQSGTT